MKETEKQLEKTQTIQKRKSLFSGLFKKKTRNDNVLFEVFEIFQISARGEHTLPNDTYEFFLIRRI